MEPARSSRYKRPSFLWGCALAVAMFAALFALHGKVMIHPNSYLLSDKGEGIRVYYVLAHHAKHSESYTEFEGMNHPYGEHIVYCDAQPAVSWFWKAVVSIIPGLAEYSVGFQNILSLYGFILAALLLFVLLQRWKIPLWLAASGSFAIVMIGPQVMRLPWQPQLAYPFIIPAMLLLYHTYYRRPEWRLVVWITLFNLFLFLINPYHGMLSSGFFFLAVLFQYGKRISVQGFLQFLVMTLVPGIIYYIIVTSTDEHGFRVKIPLGFRQFTAQIETVIASSRSLFAGLYEGVGVDMQDVEAHREGWAYIGLGGTVASLCLGIHVIIQKLRKKWVPVLQKEQRIVLWVSIIFLVFALGWPFIWFEKGEEVLGVFKSLQQLRGGGRFSWLFVFAINMVLLLMIYGLYQRQSDQLKRGLMLLCCLLLVTLTSLEGASLHADIRQEQVAGNPLQAPATPFTQQAVNIIQQKPDAVIISLPYWHVGSELFGAKSRVAFEAIVNSCALSYHTNAPLMAAHLSRVSAEETKRLMQFFGPRLLPKEIAAELELDKTYFIYHSKRHPLSAEEHEMLSFATPLVQDSFNVLLELDIATYLQRTNEELLASMSAYDSLYTQEGTLRYYSKGSFSVEDFEGDSIGRPHVFGYHHTYNPEKDGFFFDLQRDAPHLTPGDYKLSYWLNLGGNTPQSALYKTTVSRTDTLVQEIASARKSFTFFNHWMRVDLDLEIKQGQNVQLHYRLPYNLDEIVIDELYLLPEGSSVFREVDADKWMWNNYPLY